QDEVRHFRPAQIPEHHFTTQHNTARVDPILIRILRRGPVRGFEDGVPGDVIDVAARCDADAAHLRGEGIAQVIPVQVQRGDHVEVFRACEHLLERDVGDGVFDDEARAGFAFGDFAPRTAVNFYSAEVLLGDLVAPIAEGALSELHDVALVDERDAFAL